MCITVNQLKEIIKDIPGDTPVRICELPGWRKSKWATLVKVMPVNLDGEETNEETENKALFIKG